MTLPVRQWRAAIARLAAASLLPTTLGTTQAGAARIESERLLELSLPTASAWVTLTV